VERIASAEFSNMPIRAGDTFDIPEICPRHTIAQALGTTYYDHKWSGLYPMGLFQWKWAAVPQRYSKRSDKNGSFGLANIILSSTSEFPPGMHLVHHCAHKQCKEFASWAASTVGVMGAPLHLFGIDSGIAVRNVHQNVPQSRNAAENADIRALFWKCDAAAVAGAAWPIGPKRKTPEVDDWKTPEVYCCSGGRLTAKEIAVMKMDEDLQLAKSKKDKKDEKSKNDKKSKKAKKPKKIKNAAKDTNNAKNKKNAKGNCHGIMCVPGKVLPNWRSLWGQEFWVAAEDSNTIGDVKHKIFVATGVHTTSQRLIFAGRVLADDKTLAFYNIPDKAKLTYQDTAFTVDRSRGAKRVPGA
jgi:hypothetical protein